MAHQIGRRIVSGEIAEGAFLPRESELSQQFSVSRQAVREALKVLAAKGLIATRRRTGTFVLPRSEWNLLDPDVLAWHPASQLTPKFLRDLLELRSVIEPAAAELAANHSNEAAVVKIAEALDAMRAAAGETEAFVRADTGFHLAILAASGNDLIERLGAVIRPLLEAAIPLQLERYDDQAETVSYHTPVYEAIVAHAPARARRAMQQLLSYASADLSHHSNVGAARR